MLHAKKIIGTVAYLGGLPAVLEKFCWAWGQLVQFNNEYLCQPGEIVHYCKATVSLHSFARNSIVEQVKGDWLLMVDTDHEFEPDILCRLLNAMNKWSLDVVTAVYCHRAFPNSPVLYQWNEDFKTVAPIGDWDKSVEAFEIGSAGAGTLLIRTAVLKRIQEELKELPFAMSPPLGEDHSFFDRLRRIGVKAYAVPAIESPHIQVGVVRLDDYRVEGMDLKIRQVEGFK